MIYSRAHVVDLPSLLFLSMSICVGEGRDHSGVPVGESGRENSGALGNSGYSSLFPNSDFNLHRIVTYSIIFIAVYLFLLLICTLGQIIGCVIWFLESNTFDSGFFSIVLVLPRLFAKLKAGDSLVNRSGFVLSWIIGVPGAAPSLLKAMFDRDPAKGKAPMAIPSNESPTILNTPPSITSTPNGAEIDMALETLELENMVQATVPIDQLQREIVEDLPTPPDEDVYSSSLMGDILMETPITSELQGLNCLWGVSWRYGRVWRSNCRRSCCRHTSLSGHCGPQ